jgi:glycosyltransferase involved in cell wall biosynthesis
MNVLMIGFDPTPFLDESAPGDTRGRLLGYAVELNRRAPGSQLHIIIRTSRKMGLTARRLGESLFLYPTNSWPGTFILDAYRTGSRLIRQKGIVLVTTQSPFSDGLVGYLLKRQWGVKLLVQLHTSTLDDPFWLTESPANRWRRLVGLFVLRSSDGVRVVSSQARQWLVETVGLSPERVFVNPVSVSLPGDDHTGYRADGYVLFVGGLKLEKNVETLLRAFARVRSSFPEARLVIVGDGPEMPTLRQRAQEMGISDSVEWTGNVPYQRLETIYSRASVFVLPSVHESFGRVLIEAMSYGVPVVSTDTEGGQEVVQDGITGFIVPRRDPEAMARRIAYLLSHPAEAERMGSAGREVVKLRYNAERLRREWIDTWFQVASDD